MNVSMAGGRIPICAAERTCCGDIEMMEREALAALVERKAGA